MANINKNQIGYNEALANGTANALMVQYKRANAAPLDISEVFTSISAATEYALSGSTSYAGQVIAVAGEDVKTEVFSISSAGTIVRLIDENDLLKVEESAGKIDEIKVNGSALTIDGKAVNIDLSDYAKVAELLSIISTDTGKTIREIASEEIAAKLIPGDAQESLDTLAEIAAWIQEHPEDASKLNESVANLNKIAHSHDNKEVLDGITAEKVATWDAAEGNAKAHAESVSATAEANAKAHAESVSATAEANAKTYAEELVAGCDVKGAASQALVDAKKYTDDEVFATLSSAKAYAEGLGSKYDAKGDAAKALEDAKEYVESLSGNYDAAGSATAALNSAKSYADSLAENYDAKGDAAKALEDAKDYAEGLSVNYDSKGSASQALTDAKNYAESLGSKYDAKGDAAKALEDAKRYADSLAVNYDSKGSAENALSSAKAYADGLGLKYDAKGSAEAAITTSKNYVDTKLENYAPKSYVTEQIVSAMTGGEIELTGYAKLEVVKDLDTSVYNSALTYTDSATTLVKEQLEWIEADGGTEKHVVRHWRGSREKYEFLKKNGALNSWTKYVVIDTINGNETIVEYYGTNQVYDLTGQLLPVKDIIESIASITASPYDRYLVGRNGIGYRVYECVLDDENNLKWYIKPFDYRFGVRVISKGLKNYVYLDGDLITYDEVDCGEF